MPVPYYIFIFLYSISVDPVLVPTPVLVPLQYSPFSHIFMLQVYFHMCQMPAYSAWAQILMCAPGVPVEIYV